MKCQVSSLIIFMTFEYENSFGIFFLFEVKSENDSIDKVIKFHFIAYDTNFKYYTI
jgi:hypothetical protein